MQSKVTNDVVLMPNLHSVGFLWLFVRRSPHLTRIQTLRIEGKYKKISCERSKTHTAGGRKMAHALPGCKTRSMVRHQYSDKSAQTLGQEDDNMLENTELIGGCSQWWYDRLWNMFLAKSLYLYQLQRTFTIFDFKRVSRELAQNLFGNALFDKYLLGEDEEDRFLGGLEKDPFYRGVLLRQIAMYQHIYPQHLDDPYSDSDDEYESDSE